MNVALIFAGGAGSRMGSDIPKQFLEWNGKAVIIHTLNVFEKHKNIDGIVVVCKRGWIDYTRKLIEQENLKKIWSIVPGGNSALDSQYEGLREIKRLLPDEKIAVLIHDGVRPLVDTETIQRNINAVWEKGNSITVTKAIETVIRIKEDGTIREILDREECRMARAPQSFMLDEILSVHELAKKDNRHTFIDSASMMMDYGRTLYQVQGEQENIKITTPSDYYMFLGISKNHRKNGGS